jgi:hypothetical protein
MPYKIYTYADPYNLNKTDFWGDIHDLPHFCVARTLVNGLKGILQKEIHGLICPLDNLVSHEQIYKNWTDNVALRVQQYSALTSIFKTKLAEGNIDKNFFNSLIQNQTHFLNALRLFIELKISASSIDKTKGNKEQRFFIETLEYIQEMSLFAFPKTPDFFSLKQIVVSLAENELKEYIDKPSPLSNDINWYYHAIEITKKQELKSIVVHGVHQFSPAQLRLLIDMERMGITIIFLFNYQENYSNIYSSWLDIYQYFEVPIQHDNNIYDYKPSIMQNQSNALATALGTIIEGTGLANKTELVRLYSIFKDIPYYEFANITEYAHYVSDHFDQAIRSYHESLNIIERGNHVWSNAAVLHHLDEQVYTANRDVHTLLKIYYPEYASNRHFLSYPIGQFFAAVYRLWDYKCGTIKIDIPALKECLSSHVLKSGTGEQLLRTFCNVEILFDGLFTFEEFRQTIAQNYVVNYQNINSAKAGNPLFHLKSLSIYNRYRVTIKDIEMLINAINEINEIATYLFSIDNSHEDFINFGKHFQNLEDFLKQRELSLATEEERTLIGALQFRLNTIRPNKSNFSGTFRDLQEGLHYYLKQKEDDNGVDWIVKNFEQIDGDILQSKRQLESGKRKSYHFACLSDKDLNCHVDDLLPWPLSDTFIRRAYSPIDLQFQVYYSALGERSSFLRYALFYGLFFNHCDSSLSYVKQYGDEITEPYALFSILGLSADSIPLKKTDKNTSFTVSIKQNDVSNVKGKEPQMMDMFLCPYRYLLDYVMEDTPIFHGNFLYQKFYENILIEAVWKKIQRQPKKDIKAKLDTIINLESSNIKACFSFWKNSEIYDLNQRVKNYIIHSIIDDSRFGSNVKQFDSKHMEIRKLYGNAMYEIDITEIEPKNPYTEFEALADQKYPKKTYSLHKLDSITDSSKRAYLAKYYAEIRQYLNQVTSKDKTAISSDWCLYCTHKGNCMEPFLKNG